MTDVRLPAQDFTIFSRQSPVLRLGFEMFADFTVEDHRRDAVKSRRPASFEHLQRGSSRLYGH